MLLQSSSSSARAAPAAKPAIDTASAAALQIKMKRMIAPYCLEPARIL
jgi:hypothetical protein